MTNVPITTINLSRREKDILMLALARAAKWLIETEEKMSPHSAYPPGDSSPTTPDEVERLLLILGQR